MYITALVGSDDENPFKTFDTKGRAIAYAREQAAGDVERVLVCPWGGTREEGIAAAKAGTLQVEWQISHTEQPRVEPQRVAEKAAKAERDASVRWKNRELSEEFVQEVGRQLHAVDNERLSRKSGASAKPKKRSPSSKRSAPTKPSRTR
jgi:hypothetical protein